MEPTPLSLLSYLLITLLGLLIGSFINVVITRTPKMLAQRWREECLSYLTLPAEAKVHFNLAMPDSHCVQCQHHLSWKDLIPVFSFIWLKGKCRHCLAKISWQYPLVEILSAALLTTIAALFGFTIYSGILILLSEVLVALAFIDLNTQLLPDEFTLGLLWLALILSATTNYSITPAAAILGAAMGYALPWCVNYLYRLIRKREGMGYGDFKCFAAFGALLGLQALPSLFLLAVILGLIFSLIGLSLKKIQLNQIFPFGPAIIIAGWILLIWPTEAQSLFNWLIAA